MGTSCRAGMDEVELGDPHVDTVDVDYVTRVDVEALEEWAATQKEDGFDTEKHFWGGEGTDGGEGTIFDVTTETMEQGTVVSNLAACTDASGCQPSPRTPTGPMDNLFSQMEHHRSESHSCDPDQWQSFQERL